MKRILLIATGGTIASGYTETGLTPKIAAEDTSEPVMHNAQAVYAGYTYGRNSLNEQTVDGSQQSRGFFA